MTDVERYRSAVKTLLRFRTWVVNQATDTVNAKASQLEQPFGGGEEVVERYGHLLFLTSQLIGGIQAAAAEGRRPPPPVAGVDEVIAPEEELAESLAAWFRDRPGLLPLSVEVVGRGEDCRALIVHGPRVGG